MENTGIKVTEVSIETMLNDKENGSYNFSTWVERVKAYAKHKDIKFYFSAPDEYNKYGRFFVSYEIEEGLKFFKSFNPFCAGITNRGFVMIHLIGGEVFKKLFFFAEGGSGAISNTKEGRKYLVDHVCAKGTLVSSEF